MEKRGVQTWFKDLKAGKKLMLGFAAVGVIIIAVGIVGLLGLQQLRTQLQIVYENSTIALGISLRTAWRISAAVFIEIMRTPAGGASEVGPLIRVTCAPLLTPKRARA